VFADSVSVFLKFVQCFKKFVSHKVTSVHAVHVSHLNAFSRINLSNHSSHKSLQLYNRLDIELDKRLHLLNWLLDKTLLTSLEKTR
jgi:hypothetical protein